MRIAGMSTREIGWLRSHPEHAITRELRNAFSIMRELAREQAMEIGLIRFRDALDKWRNKRDWTG